MLLVHDGFRKNRFTIFDRFVIVKLPNEPDQWALKGLEFTRGQRVGQVLQAYLLTLFLSHA